LKRQYFELLYNLIMQSMRPPAAALPIAIGLPPKE